MNRTNCSYCNNDKTLTKEHLWPKSLHKRLKRANSQDKSIIWLSRLQRVISSEPQIRDVCGACNNGVLSNLDDYICQLFDDIFIHLPERDEVVDFQFNYHLLKRWLLKLSYNSARVHESEDLVPLKTLLPYILGENTSSGRSVQLFVQLTYPELVNAKDLTLDVESDGILTLYPDINRIGHMYFEVPGIGKKILRAIHIRSFTFLIAFWEPGRGRAEQKDFESVFVSNTPGVKLLRPSKDKERLVCNGKGALSSVKHSRGKFIFDERL